MESDEVERDVPGASQIHPLLIDHVLENVLESLPLDSKNLYNCRLVSRQWNFIASRVVRQRKEVTFGKFACNVDKIRDFIQICKKNLSILPVARYKLCQDIFQNQNEELLYDFFDTCGGNISSLVIWLDVKSTLLFYEQCFANLELPRLKSLTFDDRRLYDNNYDLIGGNFLRAIFRSAPNLTEVNIIFQREAVLDLQRCEAVTDIVIDIFTEHFPRHLRNLKLDLHINNRLLFCLSKLRLRSVNLCIRDSAFSQEALKTLLDSQSFSLETLRLTYLYRRTSFYVEFPKMERLSRFELRGWDNNIMNVSFSDFSYDTNLPRLKHLSFNVWTNKPDWHQFFPIKSKNHYLQTLKLSEDLSTPEMMAKICKIFPNLKRLELCLSLTALSVLEIVFESMGSLEELKINKYSSFWEQSLETIDHVFCGIPHDICRRLRKTKTLMELDYKHLQTRPSLTNLKKLRKLEMRELQYLAVLTDVTGYLAFLKMENLEVLDVGRSQIDEECLNELAKKYPNNMLQQMKMPKLTSKSICNDDDTNGFPGRCIFL